MAENRLGIGRISFPTTMDGDTLLAIEEFNRRVDDNINYLLRPNIISVSSDYTATDLNHTILCSALLTVTLPQASTVTGKILTIKRTGASNVTIDGYSSETIDGSATITLTTAYESVRIQSDGANWYKI